MINLNKKDSVAESIKDILEKKELSPKQKQIAKMSPPEHKIDAGDLSKLRAGHKPVTTEEIDPKDRTKDMIRGRRPTNQKDDVGPGSDGKSTKVRYRGGPMIAKAVDEANDGNLANNYPPYDKVTRGDVIAGRLGKDHQGGKTLKKFKEEKEGHSIYDQMIQEVLSKDASAGDWIHDFVHSDNPKFAGKSKEKRKQMALAAYYAKQRNEEVESDICPECMQDPCVCAGNHIEEDVEQIDEAIGIDPGTGKPVDHAKVFKSETDNMHPGTKKYVGRAGGKEGTAKKDTKGNIKFYPRDGIKGPLRPVTKEDVEQIDEISQKTVASYKDKAYKDYSQRLKTSAATKTADPKKEKRWSGLVAAAKREPQTQQVPSDKKAVSSSGRPYWGEEVEQIDELSKSTLGSYVKGAARDASAARKLSADFENKAEKSRKPSSKAAASRLSKRFMDTAKKRHAGIGKAVERLTKEESEQVEENAFDWKKPRPPESKGGSGVKAGRAYGGAAQKSKPEQDDVNDKKKVNEGKRPESDTVPFITNDNTPLSRVKSVAKSAMKKVKNEMLGKTGTSE